MKAIVVVMMATGFTGLAAFLSARRRKAAAKTQPTHSESPEK